MGKKKLDVRIKQLIESCVKTKHRSMFVIVGDRGPRQIVNLHYILTKSRMSVRPEILWCYKKGLGFSSDPKKLRSKQKKLARKKKKHNKQEFVDTGEEDLFTNFLISNKIRYCYYKDTRRILGNTYGMCILQDFQSLTPNLLARTIETVEGGGIVAFLLNTINSLSQLYTLTMDVHSRYRTEKEHSIVNRFNERFLLSLSGCENTLVCDDELNILPIFQFSRKFNEKASKKKKEELEELQSNKNDQLVELQKTLHETEIAGSLIKLARTLDQAESLLIFLGAISEKTLRTTVSMTASRGRGKSAALGLTIAAAIGYGYSNIFVTSPSPENLKTLFQFIFKGFDALGYSEHLDYEVVQSTKQSMNKAIIRVNIFKDHRQTIQYIKPQDQKMLSQAELLVIDEAAAIPLPLVSKMMGNYLVFLSSTISGYEGTGRSLSLKLIKKLRTENTFFKHSSTELIRKSISENNGSGNDNDDENEKDKNGTKKANHSSSLKNRDLKEVELQDPIRYSVNDPIEKWLNDLLCLDAVVPERSGTKCPVPESCELYYVNRDTLFSYHKATELFLRQMIALYVSSHYKNSPNDIQLMSDAPTHHLFVLVAPVTKTRKLPEIICVIQVALEGLISKETMLETLGKGRRGAGDLIPWTISHHYQDENFGTLSGGRIVRIATREGLEKMGYGTHALKLLTDYYSGKFTNLNEDEKTIDDNTLKKRRTNKDNNNNKNHKLDKNPEKNKNRNSIKRIGDVKSIKNEEIKPKKNLPPLLIKLENRKPEHLHYLGTSFGITYPLFRFWKKNNFYPIHIRQTENTLTGEFSCIMVKEIITHELSESNWLDQFIVDFRKRFISLLSFSFQNFPINLALSVLQYNKLNSQKLTFQELKFTFSNYDLKRIRNYARNLLDYHTILDLIPTIARLYFKGKIDLEFSPIQSAMLLNFGLQHKLIDQISQDVNLPKNQIFALFNQAWRKINDYFIDILETKVGEEIPQIEEDMSIEMNPIEETLEKTLDNQVFETEKEIKRKNINKTGKKKKNNMEMENENERKRDEEDEEAGEDDFIRKETEKAQLNYLSRLNLSNYKISSSKEKWDEIGETATNGSIISVKSDRKYPKKITSNRTKKKKNKKSQKTNKRGENNRNSNNNNRGQNNNNRRKRSFKKK
ncbi:RNA cytidine acetyltransferase [Anaeramoeba flamelloides]|uniref:RNA cytidine acetyltransferase n=1 Tax=Anaeramoeba flamelloides TaxID=1746091 RepID=A0ABQ8X8C8_9EUKA|nr:RNA cytidine acetyltransferase [Anaeramoeba flamelloides]